jgi:hypothetical protein
MYTVFLFLGNFDGKEEKMPGPRENKVQIGNTLLGKFILGIPIFNRGYRNICITVCLAGAR